jgi:C4-dicarboxylate-specific signal transduction histidine kinase
VPWLCTLVLGQLIVFRVIQGPITNLAWFLGAQLVMMFEMSRDYVSSRRALAEVADLRRHLMQRERVSVLGQLSSALAHQLAQPLTASAANVAVALQQLDKEEPDLKEVRAILVDIGSDSRRANEMIDSLRQLIKNQPIEMRPLRMEDIVQEAIVLVQGEFNARRIALTVTIPPDLPRVMGDRVHLSQVLTNLLMNSLHAVEARPPDARRIAVEARRHNDEVEVAVRDSGPGIPDADFDRLFGPFFTTKEHGMGIGLALSRTIIEAHGGRLWADRPTAGDGATFRFTLQQA